MHFAFVEHITSINRYFPYIATNVLTVVGAHPVPTRPLRPGSEMGPGLMRPWAVAYWFRGLNTSSATVGTD